MLFAVIVLCSSVYTSCANAQPVDPNAINPSSIQLVPHPKLTTIGYNPNSEVEIFITTKSPDEVAKTGGADPDGSIDENEVITTSNHVWEESGKIEGDMILNDRQRRLIVERVEGMARNGLQDITKRWPNNEVIYYIDTDDFDKYQMQAIENGIDDLRQASCVKFRPYMDGDSDVVLIRGNDEGCYSAVGYQGGGQIVNLSNQPGSGCLTRGTVAHELLHTLGFYHMQSSSDRDDYVTVLWDNIIESEKHNFNKYNEFTVTDFGVGYDYDSIMHYHQKAFTVNGRDTIVPKMRGAQIGHAVELSSKDKLKLNKMYCEAGNRSTGWYRIFWKGWR